eukprot:4550438-Alexandrium_andersonii.AAC.1
MLQTQLREPASSPPPTPSSGCAAGRNGNTQSSLQWALPDMIHLGLELSWVGLGWSGLRHGRGVWR